LTVFLLQTGGAEMNLCSLFSLLPRPLRLSEIKHKRRVLHHGRELELVRSWSIWIWVTLRKALAASRLATADKLMKTAIKREANAFFIIFPPKSECPLCLQARSFLQKYLARGRHNVKGIRIM